MGTLVLDGELTIYRAAELKETLLNALAADTRDLEINLAAVTELDSSGLQLLMMVKKAAQQQKRDVQLLAHSPAVLEVFEILNVAAHFGDPMVIADRA